MHRVRAFTLIELLVVITIIVVLLALLVPALDKAVYQAELAVCGGNLHTTAAGILAYTFDSRRYYPYRAGVTQVEGGWFPQKLAELNIDDRLPLKGTLNVNKHLVDPFCLEVDLSTEGTDFDSQVQASYDLWFGWQYWRTANQVRTKQAAMRKSGDRWGWTDTAERQWRFNLLIGDEDRGNQDTEYIFASHPDSTGTLTQVVSQDPLLPPNIKYTFSMWNAPLNPSRRGLLDNNFAYDDGSVRRLTAVGWDEWKREADGRTMRVSYYNTAREVNNEREWLQVPKP